MWPKQDTASMNAFYGNPDINGDGLPDAAFESKHLTFIIPPYPMVLAWNMKPITRLKVNKECAGSLLAVLDRIGKDFTHAEREKFHLNRFGGCYNFRPIRGGARLSIHSWGAAIDLAPELNPLGVEYGSRPNMMPLKAVAAFEDRGAAWGGRWSRGDCQHFQFATV